VAEYIVNEQAAAIVHALRCDCGGYVPEDFDFPKSGIRLDGLADRLRKAIAAPLSPGSGSDD
jgi:hypothetical protein